MEFIKKMKKREFIEMGLKTIASFFGILLAFLLLEGMIYGIKLSVLEDFKGNTSAVQSSTTAYLIEEDEENYFVIFHREDVDHWSAAVKPKDSCTAKDLTVKEVKEGAPSAVTFSVEGWHFIVLGVLVAGVGGFFAYRFVKLNSAYVKIEKQYLKDGTIEITSVALEN